ncbi:flagellar hook-length control protein FliK [Candidatus Nitrospira bockiana]
MDTALIIAESPEQDRLLVKPANVGTPAQVGFAELVQLLVFVTEPAPVESLSTDNGMASSETGRHVDLEPVDDEAVMPAPAQESVADESSHESPDRVLASLVQSAALPAALVQPLPPGSPWPVVGPLPAPLEGTDVHAPAPRAAERHRDTKWDVGAMMTPTPAVSDPTRGVEPVMGEHMVPPRMTDVDRTAPRPPAPEPKAMVPPLGEAEVEAAAPVEALTRLFVDENQAGRPPDVVPSGDGSSKPGTEREGGRGQAGAFHDAGRMPAEAISEVPPAAPFQFVRQGASRAAETAGPAPAGDPVEVASGRAQPATIHLEIEPADLGTVRMQVTVAEHTVYAKVTTERADVQDFLARHQGRLETTLNSQGLDIGRFQVDVQAHGRERTDQGRQGATWRDKAPDHRRAAAEIGPVAGSEGRARWDDRSVSVFA